MTKGSSVRILDRLRRPFEAIGADRLRSRFARMPPGTRATLLAAAVAAAAGGWLAVAHPGLSAAPVAARQVVVVIGLLLVPCAVAFGALRLHLADLEERARSLRAERDLFRSFFNDSDELFFLCDPSGRFRTINPAGIRLLGRDPVWDQLGLADLVDESSRPRLDDLIGRPRSMERRRVELTVATASARPVALQVNAVPVWNSDGDPIGFQCRAHQISSARAAPAAEGDQPDVKFQSLVQHFPDGVALLSSDGRVLLANPHGEDYLNDYGTFLAERRLVLFGGIAIDQLISQSDPNRRQEIIVREPYHQTLEVLGQRLAGDASGRCLLVIRDVTGEKQRRERLERSDRLAAVGQLAAGIAHDFKNILQGIHLCADLSTSGDLSPAEHRDGMLTIIEQTQRGSKLIQQIMDFTRQSESTQRLLDLGQLLHETRGLLAPGLPESVELRVNLSDGEFPVMVDAAQMQQVIANLVFNAKDAMPSGGLVTINLTRVGAEGDSGPVPPEVRNGQWLRIAVSDTGTGIPRSVQNRVFEPFFTTKASRGGTGLGLAQVYGNVQQHGGHVDFETSEGMGTTFHVFLPLYIYASPAVRAKDDTDNFPRGNGQTVLVVEDEIAVLTATAQTLRALGYRVLEATDASDALQFFDRGEVMDLALTDVRMPGIDGIRLAAEMKRRNPTLRVLIMSGYASQMPQIRDSQPEIDGVLVKPFSMASLAREVSRALIS